MSAEPVPPAPTAAELVDEVLWMVDQGDQVLRAATAVVATAPYEPVAELAVMMTAELVGRRLRERTLAVERAAEHPTTKRPRYGTRAYERWATETEEGRAWHAERVEWEEEWERRRFDLLRDLLQKYTDQLRIQWTEELLAQTISMPDGSTTTWGRATLSQHQSRVDMFAAQAMAGIEGAARHRKAIEAIEAAGVQCLDEL